MIAMARQTKHGLGRGLDALLGGVQSAPVQPEQNRTDAAAAGDVVRQIPTARIDPNPDQPRKRFRDESIEELAISIQSVGIIQPLIVKESGDRYQIIAGERRWRAALKIGLDTVPCIVRSWDEAMRLETSLIENLQREDLDPIEEAQGIRALMDQCGYTQEVVAQRLGKSRPAVANLLRLLNLPASIQIMLQERKLSAGHARALVALPNEDIQIRLANLAAAQGWSVRQMEQICARQGRVSKAEKPKKPEKTGEIKNLERMARDIFGTKAELHGDENKGRFILHYYSRDDLEHIWEILELLRQSE